MLALVAPTVAAASATVSYNDKLKETLPDFETPAAWQRSHPPFRVIGNVYGVGGFDLASYLITSADGHILINTSIEGSIEDISANIGALGYDIADVKILLSMQSHFDHTADLARIKEETGAKMMQPHPMCACWKMAVLATLTLVALRRSGRSRSIRLFATAKSLNWGT